MKIQELLEIMSYTSSKSIGVEQHKKNIKSSTEALKRGENKEKNILNLIISSTEYLFHSKLPWEEYKPSMEDEKELIEDLEITTNPYNILQISLDLCFVNGMYNDLEKRLVKELKG